MNSFSGTFHLKRSSSGCFDWCAKGCVAKAIRRVSSGLGSCNKLVSGKCNEDAAPGNSMRDSIKELLFDSARIGNLIPSVRASMQAPRADIVEKSLEFLPCKSLIKTSCVSRSWCAITDRCWKDATGLCKPQFRALWAAQRDRANDDATCDILHRQLLLDCRKCRELQARTLCAAFGGLGMSLVLAVLSLDIWGQVQWTLSLPLALASVSSLMLVFPRVVCRCRSRWQLYRCNERQRHLLHERANSELCMAGAHDHFHDICCELYRQGWPRYMSNIQMAREIILLPRHGPEELTDFFRAEFADFVALDGVSFLFPFSLIASCIVASSWIPLPALICLVPLSGTAFLLEFHARRPTKHSEVNAALQMLNTALGMCILMVALKLDGWCWIVASLPLLPACICTCYFSLVEWRQIGDVEELFGVFYVAFLGLAVFALQQKQTDGVLSVLPYTVIAIVPLLGLVEVFLRLALTLQFAPN